MRLKEKFLWVTSEPHRLFFTTGVLFLFSAVFWWVTYLGHKHFHVLPQYSFDPKELHSFLFIYVALTCYELGFLLTTFPRWLQREVVPRRKLLLLWVLIPWGGIVTWTGTKLHLFTMIPGSIMVFLGFLVFAQQLICYLVKSTMPDKVQPYFTLLAVLGGAAGAGAFALYQWFPESYYLYQASLALGVYFYIPLVVVTIAWRLVPFFTNVLAPGAGITSANWVLPLWALALAAKTLAALADQKQWFLLTDSLFLVVTLVQFYRWRFRFKQPNMLLSYLYISLAWFPLGALFFVLGSLQAWQTGIYPQHWDLAGLHAWAAGGFTGLVLGMSTRVTLGHSGRPLVTGKIEDGIFWLVQAGALWRVGVELGGFYQETLPFFSFVTGFFWCAAFGLWAWRFLPYFFQPRLDQPGAKPE